MNHGLGERRITFHICILYLNEKYVGTTIRKDVYERCVCVYIHNKAFLEIPMEYNYILGRTE